MFDMIESIFKVFFQILVDLTRLLFDLGKQGSLSFFNRRDRPLDAQFHHVRTVMRTGGKGFCLDGKRSMSLDDSFKNAMILGGSGVGKSTTCIIPTLLRINGPSILVHDPSSELHKASASALIDRGYEIKVVNYAEPTISDGYNPLHRVHTMGDAAKISQTLVSAGLGKNLGGDSFWNHAAESVITALISILLTQEPKYRNLCNVARLINVLASDPGKIDSLFSKYASPQLFESYKSIVAQPEKLQANILATAKTAIQLFAEDGVGKVTSFDTLDFDSLRRKKTAIFIQNEVMAAEFYSPITSIFFQQLFGHLLGSLPTPDDLSVLCLIDEASSFKAPWPLILANCRKYRVGCLLSLQERFQLEEQYGVFAAQTIESNAYARLYYTNPSLKTARELSEVLGKFQYEDEKGIRAVRPLMSPQEIKNMPLDNAILLAGHHPPMMATLHPYYKNRLRKLANLPISHRAPLLPWSSVPLLPL